MRTKAREPGTTRPVRCRTLPRQGWPGRPRGLHRFNRKSSCACVRVELGPWPTRRRFRRQSASAGRPVLNLAGKDAAGRCGVASRSRRLRAVRDGQARCDSARQARHTDATDASTPLVEICWPSGRGALVRVESPGHRHRDASPGAARWWWHRSRTQCMARAAARSAFAGRAVSPPVTPFRRRRRERPRGCFLLSGT
jgi:hypothetical protein